VKRFLDPITGLDDDGLSAFVEKLGSRWAPPSRDALIAVLIGAIKPRV